MPGQITDIDHSRMLTVIVEAGMRIMSHFGKQLAYERKSSPADYQTCADVESEQIIVDGIEKYFPNYNILAEENGLQNKESEFTFVIDPLDGTNNFVLGIPAFATSVAVLSGDEIIYGIIHHPFTGDTYFARKGLGAFKNDRRIFVNRRVALPDATVSYYCDYTAPKSRTVAIKSSLMNLDIKRYLDLWAPSFCYCAIAEGKLEAVINDRIPLYDYAAGRLIAREAGARITDFSGRDDTDDANNTFLVSNGSSLHDILVEEITGPLCH